jgi:hypothetical protein
MERVQSILRNTSYYLDAMLHRTTTLILLFP